MYRVFSGSDQLELSRNVCKCLGVELGKADTKKFNDGECDIHINETVRGKHIYLIQSAGPSADSIMELLLMISALRRASAAKITAIIPYFGYGKYDRLQAKGKLHHFGAADVCNMLIAAGVDRIVSLDLHAGQIQGFFPSKVPCDTLTSIPIAAAYFAEKGLKDYVVKSPNFLNRLLHLFQVQ